MENVLFLKYLIFLSTLILTGCISVQNGISPEAKAHVSERQFTLWMLSDIQPKTTLERNVFESAVADVNKNIGHIDMGIMPGDLLKSGSNDADFNWFKETRDRAMVTDWYQIAGNHDARSGSIFYKYFPQPQYYAVEFGNLLFLFLSDQSVASRTDISDDTYLWWKDMVENNREKIIITVTHAQLKRSGLLGSSLPSRVIHNSKRFEKVLQQEKVALWVSGHSHLPQRLSGTVTVQKNLGGTCFVNVASISDELFLDSESRFFYFQDGSDVVWMRSRNHSKRLFNTNLDIPIALGRSFSWSSRRPQVR